MSHDKSVGKKAPRSPWFSTPDTVPPKNLKDIELSLSSISDSSSQRKKRPWFLTSNYTNRDADEEQCTEVDGSAIRSVQQGVELFQGEQEHEENQSSSEGFSPVDTNLSRETSSNIELLRQSQPKNYSRIVPAKSTRKFLSSRVVNPEPPTSQIRESPKKITRRKFVKGSLYSLQKPLGWMAVHGLDNEIWVKLRKEYP